MSDISTDNDQEIQHIEDAQDEAQEHDGRESEGQSEGQSEAGSETSSETSEERARLLGWTPKEKFKGDPARWVDADKFLKKADADFGLMRSNNERLFAELKANKQAAEEAKQAAAEAREFFHGAIKREYERAKKDLIKEQREAVSLGDTERWEEIETAKQKLADDYQKQAEKPKEVAEPKDPAFDAFVKENQWYNDDHELQLLADFTAQQMRERGDTSSGIVFMKKVADKVKSIRADKFTNPNRNKAPKMEEGSSAARTKTSARNYANLPADAKKACDDMMRQGCFKDREDYAKYYDWDN